MSYKFLILFIGVSLLSLAANSQTIKELKEKKEKTQQEIEYTNWLLNKTGENSKASLNKLQLIKEQIKLRGNLINDYNDQLYFLQQSINDNEFVIEMLTEDLEKIKIEYAHLIEQAYRRRGDYNKLYFLLASENFNQAYKRLLYTRQMTKFREKESGQIKAIRHVLIQKTNQLNSQKEEKEIILNRQMLESSKLKNEKSKQSSYYSQLQKKQKELRQHLRYQQRIQDKLEKEIERLIKEEARKAKLKEKTLEEILLSSDFAKNKGHFPWPTEQGVITDKFGEHAHPVMKNILIKNNGIDITTKPGQKARSIFNGTVSKVFAIPGGNTAVIIRHGSYMSVYSNLKEIYVKQGDNVTTKQDIGLIYSDHSENDKTVLKFQIWKESTKLNPETWIAK